MPNNFGVFSNYYLLRNVSKRKEKNVIDHYAQHVYIYRSYIIFGLTRAVNKYLNGYIYRYI